ncbi:hypothetical protein LINPERPRIM_LOCUS35088 [Linum perenne]
MRARR